MDVYLLVLINGLEEMVTSVLEPVLLRDTQSAETSAGYMGPVIDGGRRETD